CHPAESRARVMHRPSPDPAPVTTATPVVAMSVLTVADPAAPRPAASAQATLTGGRPPPAPRACQRSIRWPGGEPRMSQRTDADIGVTGLAVMGRNLARNLARHGHVVALHNRSPERTRSLVAEHGDEGTFAASESMEDFVASLRRPRAI